MTARAAGFFEWVMDVQFTPAQQAEYETLLARDWQNADKRRSMLSLLQNVEKLNAATPEKKRLVHQQIQNELLDSFRKGTADEDSRWLFAIYRAAHPEGGSSVDVVPAPVPPVAARFASIDAKQLVGKWRASKASGVQYKNGVTGAMAPTNGSTFFYQFNSDGTYAFNGLMQVTTYGCSTAVYSDYVGKYNTAGDVLTLEPADGHFKVQQNCGSGNQEKPGDLTRKQFRIHFELNPNGGQLVIADLDGSGRPDYFRPER